MSITAKVWSQTGQITWLLHLISASYSYIPLYQKLSFAVSAVKTTEQVQCTDLFTVHEQDV